MNAPSHLIVLAAGGTGGHVFPAEALAAELKSREFRLALITDRRGGAYGGSLGEIETHYIPAGGIAGKSLPSRACSVLELAMGTWKARGLLKSMRPSVVVGFGGYASVPTMMAATFSNMKTALHEQNAVLGRANRLLASRVDRIATSFESMRGLDRDGEAKAMHTGMPVRPAIAAVREVAYPALESNGPVNLLVLGGSQGARVFSDIVPAAIAKLDASLVARLHITQQCRPEDIDAARAAYANSGATVELNTFFDDVPKRLEQAHLVITRSGASTVGETTSVGRPAIMVPYPHAIDDHQTANAHAVDAAGAGWLIPEDAFTPEYLAARLDSLIGLPAILERAAAAARSAGRPDAASRLADMVVDMVASGNGANGGPNPERKAA